MFRRITITQGTRRRQKLTLVDYLRFTISTNIKKDVEQPKPYKLVQY